MSTKKIACRRFFVERLRLFRGNRSKAEFARFLGVSPQVYQKYEEGRIPSAPELAKIANRLCVDVNWLLGYSDAKSATNPNPVPSPIAPVTESVTPVEISTRRIGIYGVAHCMMQPPRFGDIPPESDHDVPVTFCPPSLTRYRRVAAFRAEDNSMFPTVEPGDLLFFSPDVELVPGNVCLAKYDDQCVCKRFGLIDSAPDADIILRSDNPAVSPVRLRRSDIQWIYRVLLVVREKSV